jgi:integrase
MRVKLKLVEPVPERVMVTVRGGRRSNKNMGREREYLTPDEVDRLTKAAKRKRCGARDELMIFMCARHGLRAEELVELKRSSLNLDTARFHVSRKKGGVPSVHPLNGHELRALRKLYRASGDHAFVFVSERGAPITRAGFQRVVERAGVGAGFDFPVHPHMLRHACGYRLANEGKDSFAIQSWLGHTSLEMTRRYCALAAGRFEGW